MKLSLKERAAQFRAKKEAKLSYFLINLSNATGCTLTNGSDMFYIVSPSNYEMGSYQLTTFINNKPYSHVTAPTVSDLLKNNIAELVNYTISEVA
jgi:hypothetical protein